MTPVSAAVTQTGQRHTSVSPPCVLIGLPDVFQCFHGILETVGDPLILAEVFVMLR